MIDNYFIGVSNTTTNKYLPKTSKQTTGKFYVLCCRWYVVFVCSHKAAKGGESWSSPHPISQ